MNLKKYMAIGLSGLLVLGTGNISFAAPMYISTTKASPAIQQTTEAEKKILTLEEAIKKAISHNLNLKKYEITRESLLKQIDASYTSDQSIFAMREYQESQLPDEKDNPEAYEKAKQEMDAQFQKAMAGSDFVKASLINQRGTLDMNTVMERENVGISINRLFTSIDQKEKDIEILKRKIEQDRKNLSLHEKQLALGKISQSKMEDLYLESGKNQNNLKVEKLKLDGYYRELENLTLLSNIQRDYKLEKLEREYRPIDLSPETQRIKEQSAADFSTLVSAKTAAMKIAQSKYENYPYVAGESSYVEVSDNRYLSQLEESQAIREAKAKAQEKYNNLQELQENISLAQKNIQKLENQLKDLNRKHQLGLISKNTLDNSAFSLDEAKNSLEALKTQHYQLRQMYENSYFAGL